MSSRRDLRLSSKGTWKGFKRNVRKPSGGRAVGGIWIMGAIIMGQVLNLAPVISAGAYNSDSGIVGLYECQNGD